MKHSFVSKILTVAVVMMAAIGIPGALDGMAAAAVVTPVQVAAGESHSCARMSNGTVRCWGTNTAGNLGDGSTVSRSKPVAVSGLTAVADVRAGTYTTCARTTAGRLWCWGSNLWGAAGVGPGIDKVVKPVDITPVGTVVTSFALAHNHGCAATTTKKVYCWGYNWGGQLGLGDLVDRFYPTLVAGLPNAPILGMVGDGLDTCIQFDIPGKPNFYCAGTNIIGFWGNGTTGGRKTFVAVTGFEDSETRIMTGGLEHQCRVKRSTGTTRCTGSNQAGQLGNGSTDDALTMQTVPGNHSTIAAGWMHTCAFNTDSLEYRCWGLNETGQLGNGTTRDSSSPVAVPVKASPMATASVSAGFGHTCALGLDAQNVMRVFCWGDNRHGQLGNGSTASSLLPVQATGI